MQNAGDAARQGNNPYPPDNVGNNGRQEGGGDNFGCQGNQQWGN